MTMLTVVQVHVRHVTGVGEGTYVGFYSVGAVSHHCKLRALSSNRVGLHAAFAQFRTGLQTDRQRAKIRARLWHASGRCLDSWVNVDSLSVQSLDLLSITETLTKDDE